MGQRLRQLICAAMFATLGVVGPATAQSADLRSKINDALEMARPALIGHLKATVRGGTRVGEVALLCLAGIHDGIPADDKVLKAALKKLAKGRPHQTYDIALRLLVIEACPTFPDRMKIARKDAKALLAHRCDEGTFQYERRPSTWDLSNTQYGALGLRAAHGLGIKIPKNVWSRLAREIGDQQAPDGGFCYTRKRHGWDPYPSMTVAGIAVLGICKQALGDQYPRKKQVDTQINKAWAWMQQNSKSIGSKKERWSYYYHYGLERAAILTDVTKIGGITDWYARGAEMFVEEQLSGGGWTSTRDGFPGHRLSRKRGDSVPTSFAILFLRRKFQKEIGGPLTENIVRLVNIGQASKQKDIDECARQLVKRGKEAIPDILKALRSEVPQQRHAAVLALRDITKQSFGFDHKSDYDKNRSAVRKAELWHLKNR